MSKALDIRQSTMCLAHSGSADHNLIPFHLWWKKLLKFKKVFKYLVTGYSLLKCFKEISALKSGRNNLLIKEAVGSKLLLVLNILFLELFY